MKELAVLGIGFVVLGLPFLYFYNDGKKDKDSKAVKESKQLPESVQIAGEAVGLVFRVIVGIIALAILLFVFLKGQPDL